MQEVYLLDTSLKLYNDNDMVIQQQQQQQQQRVSQAAHKRHVYLLDTTLIHSLLTNELNLEWPFQGVIGRRILDL